MKREEGNVYKAPFTQDQLYIALENANFDWLKSQVEEFDRLLNSGTGLREIAKHFKRTETEIVLLYLDRLIKKKVECHYELQRRFH